MVFYFLSRDGIPIYMGKDKFENEELIEHGWPEDIWFHVDDMSSAHVYVRLKPGMTMNDIPKDTLVDAAALTKENSIEGCKKSSVKVVYTPWSNLLKDSSMAVGQVGFRDGKLRKFVDVPKNKPLVRQLMRSREEKFPDLASMRRDRDRAEIDARKQQRKKEREAAKALEEEKKRNDPARAYEKLFADDDSDGSSKKARGGGRRAVVEEEDFFGGGTEADAESTAREGEEDLVNALLGLDVAEDEPKTKKPKDTKPKKSKKTYTAEEDDFF